MPRAGLTRSSVVATAATLSNEQGFADLGLASIARHLGVAVPSLYKHVGGLADLRREIGIASITELNDELRRAAVGKAGPDALHALADRYRSWASANPGQYEAIQTAPADDDERLNGAARELMTTLGLALSSYGLSDPDVIDAIRLLRSLLHGFVSLVRAGGFALPQDLTASFDRMVDGLDLIFRSWAAADRPR